MQRNSGGSVNDFAIKLANVNGTGSASANGLLMQAIFRMGIPVSGKNLFPSNIQGLPTWYEIRVNNEGNTARALDYDLMVAMNAQTYARDIKEVRQGGYVLYDSSWPLDKSLYRDDVNFMPIPFAQMCNEQFENPRDRTLMKNIAYAGALVATLEIDVKTVENLLDETFKKKKNVRDLNLQRAENRLRLRQRKIRLSAAVSLAADERERRQDSDRRQYGYCAGLCLCRRHGGCLVSHHPSHFRDGRLQGILRKVPQRSRNGPQ